MSIYHKEDVYSGYTFRGAPCTDYSYIANSRMQLLTNADKNYNYKPEHVKIINTIKQSTTE